MNIDFFVKTNKNNFAVTLHWKYGKIWFEKRFLWCEVVASEEKFPCETKIVEN